MGWGVFPAQVERVLGSAFCHACQRRLAEGWERGMGESFMGSMQKIFSPVEAALARVVLRWVESVRRGSWRIFPPSMWQCQ